MTGPRRVPPAGGTAAGMEEVLGLALTVGVSLATALLSAGLGLWLLVGPAPWARRLLGSGLVVLMATPIVRVLVSLAEFVRLREWLFVLATCGVVAVLAGALLVALRVG